MPIGTSITVEMKALAVGGACVGDIVAGATELVGMKAFIPLTVPGERVSAVVEKKHDRFVHARMLRVLTPSPARGIPPCPYYADCGGCDLQHLDLAEQREQKRLMIQQTLARQGQIELSQGVELLGSDLPGFGYRSRISLHLDRAGALGFYRRSSGQVVDIKSCLLASDEILTVFKKIRDALKRSAAFIGGVTFDQPQTNGPVHVIADLWEDRPLPRAFDTYPELQLLREQCPSIRFRYRGREVPPSVPTPIQGAGHFSQVNTFGNRLLMQEVTEAVTTAEVTELYAGAGNFSLPLALRNCTVEAVEVDGTLVELGVERARQSGVDDRIQFFGMSCEEFMRLRQPKSTVVLDPPRSGAKEVVAYLTPAVTQSIIYVSCNLPTLVRDLKALKERGYEVQRVKFVDMFPQTHHVETLSILRALPR